MNCPNCQQEMEREDITRRIRGKEIPAADYICPECGAHYFWILYGRGLERIFDPRENTDGLLGEE